MGLLHQAVASVAADYTASVLQALLVLVVTAALAYLSLRFGAARGLWGGVREKQLQVEERVQLDARSQLLIVRVEGRRLLLATHAQGGASLLTELAPAADSQRAPAPLAPEAPPTRDAGT